ncbi:hypothetical protein LC593_17320 [Nostoc sp. CHAB 5844]|nr:hypothetical protein [Nostoc sp. CHAB 5844]
MKQVSQPIMKEGLGFLLSTQHFQGRKQWFNPSTGSGRRYAHQPEAAMLEEQRRITFDYGQMTINQ